MILLSLLGVVVDEFLDAGLSCAKASYSATKGTALTLGLAHAQRGFNRVAMFLPISDAVTQACLPGIAADRIDVIPSFVADDVATRSGRRPGFLPDGALGEHKGIGLRAKAHERMTTAVPLVVIGSRRPDTPC